MGKSFFKKVVVAINGRESSVHAAMYAIMLSRTYGAELKFVYVVDTATIKYLTMNRLLISDEKESFEKKLEADGTHYLDYAKKLALSKGVKAGTELRSGGVFTEIIKYADETESDLIIMGSESRELLQNARCPVLIVNKKNIEAEFKVF